RQSAYARRPGGPSRVPHGRGLFPAGDPPPPRPAPVCLRHQGRLLELVAHEATGRRRPHLAPAGAGGDGVRTRPDHPAVEPAVARDDLPQTGAASDGEKLPVGPLHARRRALRVRRGRDQHELGPARALCLRLRPWSPRKDPRRTQRRVCPRRRSHQPLRGQQRLAAAECARLQPPRNFQLDTLATPKPRSRKRTYAYLLRSMRTLRFLLIARAGRLTRIGGRHVLRLAENSATQALYTRIEHALIA